MKQNISKRILSFLLTVAMVIGLIPLAVFPVAAYEFDGRLNASNLGNVKDMVLRGNAILNMDEDITINSITGDYNLTLQGSGKLTMTGNLIANNLNVTCPLVVEGRVEAQNELYVDNSWFYAYSGVRALNSVRINATQAVIAGTSYGVSCTDGGIQLTGDITVGAREQALEAQNGQIGLNGDITLNSTDALEYCVTSKNNVYTDTSVNLKVSGSSGIISYQGDILLIGGTLDVQTDNGFAVMAESGEVQLSYDQLTAVSMGGRPGEVRYPYGIGAKKDITVSVLNQAGIAGYQHGVYSMEGNITLEGGAQYAIGSTTEDAIYSKTGNVVMNGDFHVMSDESYTIYAPEGAVTIEGSLDSEGLLDSPRNDDELESNNIRYTIEAKKGFDFYGTTLKLRGVGGIDTDGDMSITAERVDVVTQRYSCLEGANVYIDCDDLHVENRVVKIDSYISPGIFANHLTVYSDRAYICGDYGIYASKYDGSHTITLKGYFVVAGMAAPAIFADTATVEGSLIAQSYIEDGISTIHTDTFRFSGEKLEVQGNGGIFAYNFAYNGGSVDITAETTKIITDSYAPINAQNGSVYVDSDELYLVNRMLNQTNESDTDDGIFANQIELYSENGTIVGTNGISADNVYASGKFGIVGTAENGICAKGSVSLHGDFAITGTEKGIEAKEVTFDGSRLDIYSNTGIHATELVYLTGGNIKIVADGEYNSGIWSEGVTHLGGNVTIETGGWYGINAEGDLTLEKGYYQISGPKNNAQAVKVGGELYMNGTLRVVEPNGGHVNGNSINGAGDAPARDVVIYSPVESVDIMVSTPSDGQYPIWDSAAIYDLPPLCTFESITWYENGVQMPQDAPFTAGNQYTAEILLSADDGYLFLPGVMGTVNGKSVTTSLLEGRTQMLLRAELGTCNTAISSVELSIAAPVEGNKPSTGVSRPDGAHYGVYSRDVQWQVSTDGKNYTTMSSTAKFEGGKYYRVYMDVNLSSSKYAFRITTADGTVQPDVLATVNGGYATVTKAYDQDPEKTVTVCFDFGKCNNSVIEEIAIVDIVAPVAGQHPSYTANVSGTGYRVDTTKNSYYDAYWKNPPEKWYFVKNGVSWWDVTDGDYDYVYENDVFLPGHDYRCEVYVCTEDGYEFVMDLYTDPETYPTVTVNGKPGELNFDSMSNLQFAQEAAYTFRCEAYKLRSIVVNGIDAPQKGNAPDYTAYVACPDLYELDTDYGLNGSGIYWYDCEGRQLEEGEVFGDAGPYRLAIKFVPVYAENLPVCEFADDMTVVINGKTVTPSGQWDDVVVGSGTAWGYYTFRSGASAPTLGSTVSGSIVSFGDANGQVTVQLIKQGYTKPDYETTAIGGYTFADVIPGIYTLRVSKANHVTREYTVTVGNGSVTQDVKLHLIGDVDGNGHLNMGDILQVYAHITGSTLITDAYHLACADTTGEGRVNMGDISRTYAHVRGTNPLW